MKIISENYFYPEYPGTGLELSIITDEQKLYYVFNTDYVDVWNHMVNDKIIVDMDHENQQPVKIIDGVNGSIGENTIQVGFWRKKAKI